MRRISCIAVIMLFTMNTMVFSADTTSVDPILKAIGDLEKARESSADQAIKDRIDKALASLKNFAPKTTDGAAVTFTEKDLRRIFSAPFSYSKGIITLAYEWNSKDIQDWKFPGDKPTKDASALSLPMLATMEHKAVFTKIAGIRGELALGMKEGEHVKYGTLSLTVHSYNAWFINVRQAGVGKELGQQVYDKSGESGDPKKFLKFDFYTEGRSAKLVWDQVKFGVPVEPTAGSFSLCGGKGGNRFRTIVISGTLDPDWVKSELDLADIKKGK